MRLANDITVTVILNQTNYKTTGRDDDIRNTFSMRA